MGDRDNAWAEAVVRRLVEMTDEQRLLPHSLTNGVAVLRCWVDGEWPHLALSVVYRHPWWDFTTALRLNLDDLEAWWPGFDGSENSVEAAARRLSEEIGEPLGAEPLTIAEDGIHWWGDDPLPGGNIT